MFVFRFLQSEISQLGPDGVPIQPTGLEKNGNIQILQLVQIIGTLPVGIIPVVFDPISPVGILFAENLWFYWKNCDKKKLLSGEKNVS